MASSKDYLDYILGQLSLLDEITYRAMMGEYILYYRGKVIGGIYDNRLLVKPVPDTSSVRKTAAGSCCTRAIQRSHTYGTVFRKSSFIVLPPRSQEIPRRHLPVPGF